MLCLIPWKGWPLGKEAFGKNDEGGGGDKSATKLMASGDAYRKVQERGLMKAVVAKSQVAKRNGVGSRFPLQRGD